jgi:hypothetical protein
MKSFQPLALALTPSAVDLAVEQSILDWNTHSAYKVVRMFPVPGTLVTGGAVEAHIQLNAEIKTVVRAYPSTMQEELFSNHPMWVLLGFITLDRYTNDLMLLSHTFEGYRIYLGNDFRWKWIRSDDSTKGGWLFLQQVPRGSSAVAVIGTKRILPNEDILDEFIYGWIRQHARATVMMLEGNILRKSQMIGLQTDGQTMVDEGLKERDRLIETLRKESRWIMMAQRR